MIKPNPMGLEVVFQSQVLIASFGVFLGVFWGYISNRERYITKHLKKIKTGTLEHSMWASFIVIMNLFIGTAISMGDLSIMKYFTQYKLVTEFLHNPWLQVISSFLVGMFVMPIILWLSETSLEQKLKAISSILGVFNKLVDFLLSILNFYKEYTKSKDKKSNDST